MKGDLQGLFSTLRDEVDSIPDHPSEGSSSADDLPSLADAAPSSGERTPDAVASSSRVPPRLIPKKAKRRIEDPSQPCTARKRLRFSDAGSTDTNHGSKKVKDVSAPLSSNETHFQFDLAL